MQRLEAQHEDPGEPDEPILAIYLLVLPEPLPIAHLSTFTHQLDEREPLLDGVAMRPLKHLSRVEPASEAAEGHNFVSLRFWQVRDNQEDVPEFVHRTRLAGRVAEALTPDAVRTPEPMTNARPDGHDPYRTVVEAVTFVATVDDLFVPKTKPEPLNRCIDVLTSFHRGYRLATRSHVPELTYERIHPAVMWLRRSLSDADARPTPAGMLFLENRNFGMANETPLDDSIVHQIAQYNARGAVGDPFGIYAERRLEAEIEAWTNGRPRECVVQCGIAAEVLLGALLGLAMWEEHRAGELSIEGAATVLSSHLKPRIESQYAKRFGGKWRYDEDPIKRWNTDIAALRHRAVHAGVEPEKGQAAAALDALGALERYVGDRLAVKWKTYPRTAWLFLGTDGFRKRGKKKLQAVEEWVANDGTNVATWLREYQEWRSQVTALM